MKGRMTAELHRHGICVIDHNDATLLWNDCAESVAEIALLFSAQSRDWNRGVEVYHETGVNLSSSLTTASLYRG